MSSCERPLEPSAAAGAPAIRTPHGDGAVWGTVTALRRQEHLEIEGPIGMSGPVAGVVRVDLEQRGDATLVRLSHEAVGRVDDDTRRSYRAGWDPRLRDRPALIVWGDKDIAFRSTKRRRFEQTFPSHEVVELPGAGHYVEEDAAERIAAAIRVWWDRDVIGA